MENENKKYEFMQVALMNWKGQIQNRTITDISIGSIDNIVFFRGSELDEHLRYDCFSPLNRRFENDEVVAVIEAHNKSGAYMYFVFSALNLTMRFC